MIYDLESNSIKLSKTPNSHFLILGMSGMGKTFFLCRKVEETIKDGKQIIIFDYSGSYTKEELEKNKFKFIDSIAVSNPIQETVDFSFAAENLSSNIANTLFKLLVKQGYRQKKLLVEAVNTVLKNNKKFSFSHLIQVFEVFWSLKKDEEEKKNITRLLSKLDLYCSDLQNIFISPYDGLDKNESQIWIIQISDFGELQRKFCAEFLVELFWQSIRHGEKKGDVFILDEFQNMTLKPGSALSVMLREGRKYGLCVWLASQFLGDYDKEAVDTLLQVGHKIFFRPTENDEQKIADFINPNENKLWRKIVRKLTRGEAILKGKYFINDGVKEIETPIICKIQAKGDEG